MTYSYQTCHFRKCSTSVPANFPSELRALQAQKWHFKIHQRGVQWKQGVVVHIILWAVLIYDTTPIHCTPLRLHPPFDEYPGMFM